MIVIRNVFQLKFGKAREAVAMWKEGIEIIRKAGAPAPDRILTDLVGKYYTLVVETKAANLAEFEASFKKMPNSPEMQAWYQKFSPLVESGHREIFNVVE